MRKGARLTASLLALGSALVAVVTFDAASAGVAIFTNTPFQIHDNYTPANQTGGESQPTLTSWDFNGGFVATWLNYRTAADRRAYVGFYSSFASQIYPGPSLMGNAAGPTSGKPAVSAGPVMFANGTSLVLFSADRRGAAAANKRDIFAQRMGNGPWVPVGNPLVVNSALANAQDSILVTRLSTGNALTAFLTHATAASTFDIKGRVLNSNGAGVTVEKALTVNTASAQTPIALAPLTTAGRSVLSYVVRLGQTQHAILQRFDATATRLGNPILVKTTTGAATYGAAGVAGLSNGRFIALWFVAGPGGTASLKGRIFSATGAPGALLTIGIARIPAGFLQGPKIAVAPDGKIVAMTAAFANGSYSLQAWVLSATGAKLIGPYTLTGSAKALTPVSLIRLTGGGYIASWTEAATSPTATRAMGMRFTVTECARC